MEHIPEELPLIRHFLGMSVGQMIGTISGIVAVLSVFIEFVPVKFNPVSLFLGWIGERINKRLLTRVDALEEKVDGVAKAQKEMGERFDEKDAINCRIRILTFSDELRRNLKHSKESYDQVLTDIDDYEHYCEHHPDFKNSRTVVAQSRIKEAYKEAMDNDEFL